MLPECIKSYSPQLGEQLWANQSLALRMQGHSLITEMTSSTHSVSLSGERRLGANIAARGLDSGS